MSLYKLMAPSRFVGGSCEASLFVERRIRHFPDSFFLGIDRTRNETTELETSRNVKDALLRVVSSSTLPRPSIALGSKISSA